MTEIAKTLLEWGPLGVFLLSVADSAGIPLPSLVDALLVAVVIDSPGRALLTALAAIVGSLIGNTILYTIARKGGRAYLDRLTVSGRGKRFRRWFDEYGLITVFVPAVSVVPMPLKVFSVCAAVFGVTLMRFLGVMLIARIIRYGAVAWLAASVGRDAMAFTIQHKWWFLGGALLLGIIFSFVSRIFLKKPAPPAEA